MLELLAPTITIDQWQETYYISLVIFPIWIKITKWNYGTKMYPKKKKCRKIHEICACLHIWQFCFQYFVVFMKSPKNLNDIFYQMDHIW